MRKSNLTPDQITDALNDNATVPSICKRLGISEATYYRMKKRYSGLNEDALKQQRELEEEKARLLSQIKKLRENQAILEDLLSHVRGQ